MGRKVLELFPTPDRTEGNKGVFFSTPKNVKETGKNKTKLHNPIQKVELCPTQMDILRLWETVLIRLKFIWLKAIRSDCARAEPFAFGFCYST